ncbi:hypothetical protein AAK894_06955 [Lachnospiraceae bacterium 46-61]
MEQQKYIEGGFIKLYRSILKWEWYDDINVKVLFLHLLLKANYEYKKWHGIEIQKGELVTSISQLSKETNLTTKQVRNCIKKLQMTGEIKTKGANKYTLIHIEKYGFFQCYETEKDNQKANEGQINDNQRANEGQIKDNQKANEGQINDNQRATTKEIKEVKEIKEIKQSKQREEKKETVYQLIADMYNATCVSFARCTKLSEAREKALRARLKRYTVEDFQKVFEAAENSNFLKGANRNNWSANFDWLIKDGNMAKVLDGNYSNDMDSAIQQKSSNIFLDIAQQGGMLF